MTSIPMSDVKNTTAVSALCRESAEPVLVTKNGRPDFWLVSPAEMERLRTADESVRLHEAVSHSERQWRNGEASDMLPGIGEMRARHGP